MNEKKNKNSVIIFGGSKVKICAVQKYIILGNFVRGHQLQ